jgi:hypothetical protein
MRKLSALLFLVAPLFSSASAWAGPLDLQYVNPDVHTRTNIAGWPVIECSFEATPSRSREHARKAASAIDRDRFDLLNTAWSVGDRSAASSEAASAGNASGAQLLSAGVADTDRHWLSAGPSYQWNANVNLAVNRIFTARSPISLLFTQTGDTAHDSMKGESSDKATLAGLELVIR